MTIIHSVQDGCAVGFAPGFPSARAAVSLSEVYEKLRAARRVPALSAGELAQLSCLHVPHEPQIAGVIEIGALFHRLRKRLKKFGHRLKRAASKIVSVAKKIVHNKIVSKLWQIAKAVVPPPFSGVMLAAESAAKLTRAVIGGSKRAIEIAKHVRDAVHGRLSIRDLEKKALDLGIHPKIVRDAALIGHVAERAKAGDPKAAAALHLARTIHEAHKSPEHVRKAQALVADLQVRRKHPDARTFTIARHGRLYHAIVVPAEAA